MTDTADDSDDGIRSEDLGYGAGANKQQGGGLGAALPGLGGPPTGTGEQVVDAEVDEASTKPTTNTSSGSPAVNSPGPSTEAPG